MENESINENTNQTESEPVKEKDPFASLLTTNLDKEKIFHYGYKSGIKTFLIGLGFIILTVFLVYSLQKYFPYILAVGYGFCGYGLGLLICPGKKVFEVYAGTEPKEKSNIFLHASSPETKIVSISLCVVGIIISIYLIISDTFMLILPISVLFLLIAAVTGTVLYVVKFFKCLRTPSDEDELKQDETEYTDTVSRNLLIAGICALVAVGSFAFLSHKNFSFRTLTTNFDPSAEYYDTSFEKDFNDLFGKYVPYRIVDDNGKKVFFINLDEIKSIQESNDENNEELIVRSVLTSQFDDILETVLSSRDFVLTLSKNGDQAFYSEKNLSSNPKVKEFSQALISSESEETVHHDKKLFTLFSNNKNSDPSLLKDIVYSENDLIVYAEPDLNSEYFMMWDFDSFTEFFNKQYDSNLNKADLLLAIAKDEISWLNLGIRELSVLLIEGYAEDYSFDLPVMFNYMTENSATYSVAALKNISSEIRSDAHFMEQYKILRESLED